MMSVWRALSYLLLEGTLVSAWLIGWIDLTTLLLGVVSVGYVAVGGRHTLWLAYKTLPRDFRAGVRYLRLTMLVRWARGSDMCIADMFERNVASNPDKVALIWEGQEWTFKQLSDYSNRVANYLALHGMRSGDCVALFMTNRPEYVATWLGASKLGVVTALINSNLHHLALYHCIAAANATVIICGLGQQDAVEEVRCRLGDNFPVMVLGAACADDITLKEGINFDRQLSVEQSTSPAQLRSVHFSDKLLYIYTSGTTGLPKAAIITNARFLFFCGAVHFLVSLSDTEVIYNPLPLYHTAGGMVGMGQVLVFNCTAVIKTKFSVSQYWKDCAKYNCTVGQYVGEICRYLLNSPAQSHDTEHKVRVMFGNGVRPQIWEQFTARFNMPRIAEFYGATESNANIINYEGKPGACGFLSLLFPGAYPVALIRVHENTGEAVRGPDGLCITCKPGEVGEFVGKIKRQDPLRDFYGYAGSANATEKKTIKDVFSKGDLAFLSGDILVCDELGYVYFKDRTGDTFRWRGENVSTAEVEGQVSLAADNCDAVVFGVEVPDAEGKAGMAVLVMPDSATRPLDLATFHASLTRNLPPYALPLFLRMVTSIDTTGTFKLKKLDLQKAGYKLPNLLKSDGEEGDHCFFFLDSKKFQYVPLTKQILQKILDKKAGL